ncbi:MAG: hypothetical protein JEY94_05520 [Melioribacteraceae bacterium]|nr:hypothetical protein [Melioribacteraceae bacterium]
MSNDILTLLLSYEFISTALVILVILIGILFLFKGTGGQESTIVIPQELLNDELPDNYYTGDIKYLPKQASSIDDIKSTFSNYT